MTGPPAARPSTQPSIRLDEKQGRAAEARRRVRIVSAFGVVEMCDEERARRVYAGAPNAEAKVTHSGRLVAIYLGSFGDDRGHLGENHGRSTITTERVRNEAGAFVGHARNLQHKPHLPQPPVAGTITSQPGASPSFRACEAPVLQPAVEWFQRMGYNRAKSESPEPT